MSFKQIKENIEKTQAEAKYADLKQYTVSDVVTELKTKGLREVKVAGVVIGAATSDEDEAAMIENLHHFGKDLTTPCAVHKALSKMHHLTHVAQDIEDAGLTIEKELSIDNTPHFLINGELYNENGEKVSD